MRTLLMSLLLIPLAVGCGDDDNGKPDIGEEDGTPDTGEEDGTPDTGEEDGTPDTGEEDGTPGADGEDGEDGTPGADGEDGTPGADGEDGTPGADGEDGTPGADGEDGTPGADGEDGTPGADGEDGTPGADGDCSGVETLAFIDDGVTWPTGATADTPTVFTAQLNDTGMEVSLALYGLETFTYTGGNEFTATLSESTSFIVMATDSCSVDIHTVVFVLDAVAEPGSTSFEYTGDEQAFTVPDGVTSINVEAFGGMGGDTGGGIDGGLGGYVQATLDVTPGQILNVFVGQMGLESLELAVGGETPGGYNGGGSVNRSTGEAGADAVGVYHACDGCGGGGGTGGGATDIRAYPYGLEDRLVVAGGGAGAPWDWGGMGGSGGGLVGGSGDRDGAPSYVIAGQGGTQTEGGIGAWYSASFPNEDGTFGIGGDCWHDGVECGAGGGGWYGGGGGAWAGGGGGSSYTIPAATGVEHEQGVQYGNGELYISW
jgi:hypothetical protein